MVQKGQSYTKQPAARLTKRLVDSLPPGEMAWDSEIKGFGCRASASGRRTFVYKYQRGRGRKAQQRWFSIGAYGDPWTAETARIEARKLAGEVAEGGDPSAKKDALLNVTTVAELCDAYFQAVEVGEVLTRAGVPKRKSTTYVDRGRVERHIKPLLGAKPVPDITTQDIATFIASVTSGKTAANEKTKKRGRAIVTGGAGTATRAVGLLGAIFSFATERKLRPDNPVRGVRRPRDKRRDRRLDADEYKALGDTLAALEAKRPVAIAVVRLLSLTGMRKGEALSLRWADVDEKRKVVRLTGTKTGDSMRPLGTAALAILADIPRTTSDFVFPASRGKGHYVGIPKVFDTIADAAKLPDVTLHTLRHSFASTAHDLGYSETTIGLMIGHAKSGTTGRYLHVIDSVLTAATDRVCKSISDALNGIKTTADVVQLPLVRA